MFARTQTRPRRLTALVMAATLTLALGACGDDNDDAAPEQTTSTTGTAVAETPGGGGSGDAEVAEFCSGLQTLGDKADSPLEDQLTAMKELRETTPSELQGDFDTMIGLLEKGEAPADSDEGVKAVSNMLIYGQDVCGIPIQF